MSNMKTGLMFSPLTEKVYWGRMNVETGVATGHTKKDITSDFIGVMLQKFPINTKRDIECNGKTEAVVFVVDEEKANRYEQSKAMYEMLDRILSHIENDSSEDIAYEYHDIKSLLAKARGETND